MMSSSSRRGGVVELGWSVGVVYVIDVYVW